MFTGIIEEVGALKAVEDLEGGRRFTIAAKMAPELRVDQSVAVNGVCMTVEGRADGAFRVTAVAETLRKTTLGGWGVGIKVNLERATTLGERLDGHLVQGHVDAPGRILAAEGAGADRLFTVAYPPAFGAHLIPVGSVAVDGVSLTVARLAEEAFTVAIIPYTLAHTNAGDWAPGAAVNLEFDLIGKYVARWMEARAAAGR